MIGRAAIVGGGGDIGDQTLLELVRAVYPDPGTARATQDDQTRKRFLQAVAAQTDPGAVRRWSAAEVAVTLGALAAAVAASALVIALQTAKGVPGNYLDLLVYREAVIAWHTGHPVYDSTFTFARLPFTYPPFALLPLAWTLLVSPRAAGLLQLTASLTSLAALSWVSVRTGLVAARGRLRGPGWHLLATRAATPVTASALFTVGLLLEPVTHTLDFGQVNLVLAAAVITDLLVIAPRWRGLITGLATAIKLTPGAFVLYLLLTRQRAAARRWAVGYAAATSLGALLAPADSLRYWISTVWHNRTGPVDFAGNQNWAAITTRWGTGHLATTMATLTLDAATVAVGAIAITRASRIGHPLTAVCMTALTGLLVSPVSWSHHWVWVVALLAALVLERPVRDAGCWATAFAAVFVTAPFWHSSTIAAALGGWSEAAAVNSYTLTGAAVLAAAAIPTEPTPQI